MTSFDTAATAFEANLLAAHLDQHEGDEPDEHFDAIMAEGEPMSEDQTPTDTTEQDEWDMAYSAWAEQMYDPDL